MAQANNPGTAGNTAVPSNGDHDRVAMLSLHADGTPNQHRPEIIGDKEFALEATKRQFSEQAVSAVDQAERAAAPAAETVEQDPAIAERQAEHEKVQASAESAAEGVVDALFTGETEPAAPAATPAKATTGRAAVKPTDKN